MVKHSSRRFVIFENFVFKKLIRMVKSVFSVSIRVQKLFVRTSVLDDRIVVYESGDR